jgi:hypothetical protein
MMAEDLRERIIQFPWVREVKVELVDHFTADEINRGIASGASFTESFPAEGGGDLAGLRRLFRLKAFQRRQYLLLRYLLDNQAHLSEANAEDGAQPEVENSEEQRNQSRANLLAMTIAQLRALSITDDDGAKLRTAYLEILPEFSRSQQSSDSIVESPPKPFADFVPQSPLDSLAFILPNGSPLDPNDLDNHLRQLRRTTINIEFNAALCTSLLKSRNSSTDS